MTLEQINESAKLVAHTEVSFHRCFDGREWADLEPDSFLGFRGLEYAARYMRERCRIEPFVAEGEPPHLKFECSDECIERFSKELMARVALRSVRGIRFEQTNVLRANAINKDGPVLIEPSSTEWQYAQYEIGRLYGANPLNPLNSLAILSARLLPPLDIKET